MSTARSLLLLHYCGSPLGCFVYQEAHFGVFRLKVDGKPVFAQLFRRDRPNGADHNPFEPLAKPRFETHFLGDTQEMRHLNRRGK